MMQLCDLWVLKSRCFCIESDEGYQVDIGLGTRIVVQVTRGLCLYNLENAMVMYLIRRALLSRLISGRSLHLRWEHMHALCIVCASHVYTCVRKYICICISVFNFDLYEYIYMTDLSVCMDFCRRNFLPL